MTFVRRYGAAWHPGTQKRSRELRRRRTVGTTKKGRSPSFAPSLSADCLLLNKQHLAIRRQRPEIVGDDRLQLVAERADLVHRRQDRVARVLGVREGVAVGVMVQRLIKVRGRLLELGNRPDER